MCRSVQEGIKHVLFDAEAFRNKNHYIVEMKNKELIRIYIDEIASYSGGRYRCHPKEERSNL
jgi:Mg-chelatase subunit ChlD